MAQRAAVVQPEGLPPRAGRVDAGAVGDDVDVRGLVFAEEVVQRAPQQGRQAGGDDAEGDAMRDAAGGGLVGCWVSWAGMGVAWVGRPKVYSQFVKGLEAGVDLEGCLHGLEAGLERDLGSVSSLCSYSAQGLVIPVGFPTSLRRLP